MERYRDLERDAKTKAYSKEGAPIGMQTSAAKASLALRVS